MQKQKKSSTDAEILQLETDKSLSSFRSSLWSDDESSKAKTFVSWALPLSPVPWDENDKPMERLLSYADLTLTEAEENGLLTDRIVAACSSYLTESPGNKCHVVAKVSLNNKNLNDIRVLGYHRFLQYVDLSWNNLTNLTPLGCLPYLMYLDVSHNLMEEVLRFRPPLNLTYVNYSYNKVWQIDDLTDFWSLTYLDFSHNEISKIQGLHDLRYLRHLDLSHNKIERFENLNNLRITDLNLEYNLISRFEMEQGLGMRTMPHLSNVYLNNNLISSLEFLEEVYSLKKLELQCNNISDLAELSHLKLLNNLRHLNLSGNPVSELKPYRSLLLNFLQELKFLDQSEVDISERIAACKRNKFDVQLEAARNHARMILLEQLNDTSLDLDVLPIDQGSYPFVILVGPSASSKKFIVSLLGEKYQDKIHVGRLQTTRKVLDSEKSILEHVDKEEFNEKIKQGKFLCVSENLGHLYGFGREELAMAVKEHKLCLTAMDMVSALTIHSYGIQPFLVLAIPQSREEHVDRLKKTYGPVLSVLGAAYISQRQLADNHAYNLKRVKLILSDILNNVMQQVADSSSFCHESSESFTGERAKSGFDGKNPPFLKQDLPENDALPEFAYFRTNNECFVCSPTKCGYQDSRIPKESESESIHSSPDNIKGMEYPLSLQNIICECILLSVDSPPATGISKVWRHVKEENKSSFNSTTPKGKSGLKIIQDKTCNKIVVSHIFVIFEKPSCKMMMLGSNSNQECEKFLLQLTDSHCNEEWTIADECFERTVSSSSNEDLSSQKGETSYSASAPLRNNGDLSYSEISSYGEDDPFVNWSMPFVNWSEVNLTSVQLEEAAEILCEKYIENIMSTRDVYQNLHLENPGLFSLSVFTDDTDKAVKEITKFLKEVWRSTPKREPVFDVENDLVYQTYVPRKLDKLKEMLRNDFLSADGDGTFKGLSSFPTLNSSAPICAEMHLKGYGDFAENL